MARRRTAPTRRPRPANHRRLLHTLTRKARRAVRRRVRRAWRRSLRRYATWRRRQLARRVQADRQRRADAASASELSVRSVTGKPRPAKKSAPSTAPAGGTQTTKRTRDGKFNGSTPGGKRAAAKKTTAAKKVPVPAAQCDLARGDATLRRVEGRLNRTERRIDGMF